MIDKLIPSLLFLKGNETTEISIKSQVAFMELIIQITRIKYGIRYHDYDRECQCQPECKIKELLEDKELKDFLKQERVLEDITELLNNPINKDKTVWEDE